MGLTFTIQAFFSFTNNRATSRYVCRSFQMDRPTIGLLKKTNVFKDQRTSLVNVRPSSRSQETRRCWKKWTVLAEPCTTLQTSMHLEGRKIDSKFLSRHRKFSWTTSIASKVPKSNVVRRLERFHMPYQCDSPLLIYINKIPRVSVCLSVCYSTKNFLTTECRIVKFCMQVHVNTGLTLSQVITLNFPALDVEIHFIHSFIHSFKLLQHNTATCVRMPCGRLTTVLSLSAHGIGSRDWRCCLSMAV